MLIYDYYTAKSPALHPDPLQVTSTPSHLFPGHYAALDILIKDIMKTVKMEALSIKLTKNSPYS